MASSFTLLFSFMISHFQINHSQTCTNGLSSPPTLIWTPSPTSADIFTASLTFDVATKTFNSGAISLTTRLYNHQLGGPTLRMQRGKQYQLTLINNLGPERAQNAELLGNQERDPNTTNLHTHGLHISGLHPGDHIFVPVHPGGNNTYIYNIPCHHSGGIHWYHAHHHPSVQLHVAGGAAGAIVIEDDTIEEGLPDWYTNMRELIFFINHIDSEFFSEGYPPRTQAQIDNQIILALTPSDEDIYIINGQYLPNICMTVGEWVKFRFAQTEVRDPQRYQIGNAGTCTVQLLARDGVIVQSPPRSVGNIVWLAESSRADVAINCVAGIHEIIALRENGDMIIAYMHVESGGNGNDIPMELATFEPVRPAYLTSLVNAAVDQGLNMRIRHDGLVINGAKQIFGIQADPFFQSVEDLSIGTVNEWELDPQDLGSLGGFWHPFHIHINHFQIVAGFEGRVPVSWQQQFVPPYGYQEVGDFIDTLWGPGVVRFTTDVWGGPMLVHCHRLEHEVGGAMGSVYIQNGCDNGYGHYNNALGTCQFNTDSCLPTLEPTVQPSVPTVSPTRNPSSEPTYLPSMIPTDLPSEIPTYLPSMIPTDLPSEIPTPMPTNNPSMDPTIVPTYLPTVNPSAMPTIYPSIGPTNVPSLMPSVSPTFEPTIEPTQIPTLEPTNIPTFSPTNMIMTLEILNETRNETVIIPSSDEITENNNIRNENATFEVNHAVGIYSIIGICSFCGLMFVICNCLLYRKRHSSIGAKPAKHVRVSTVPLPVLGNFSLKSMDTQVNMDPFGKFEMKDESPILTEEMDVTQHMIDEGTIAAHNVPIKNHTKQTHAQFQNSFGTKVTIHRFGTEFKQANNGNGDVTHSPWFNEHV